MSVGHTYNVGNYTDTLRSIGHNSLKQGEVCSNMDTMHIVVINYQELLISIKV